MRATARLIAAVLGVSVVLLAAACSSDSGPETITVENDNSGETVDMSVDDTLEVSLLGSDVSQYQWDVVEADDAILSQTNKTFDNQSAGAGGNEVFTYKAVKAGTTPLKADLVNLESPDEQARETFEITVVVSE